MMAGSRWYVVHTQPNREARADLNLRRQGFSTYLPRYVRRRRHARRHEMVARPLFPRYLFVALDPARDRWRAIHSTFGVNHLVLAGEEPLPVPDGVVDEIRARENGDGFVKLGLPGSPSLTKPSPFSRRGFRRPRRRGPAAAPRREREVIDAEGRRPTRRIERDEQIAGEQQARHHLVPAHGGGGAAYLGGWVEKPWRRKLRSAPRLAIGLGMHDVPARSRHHAISSSDALPRTALAHGAGSSRTPALSCSRSRPPYERLSYMSFST